MWAVCLMLNIKNEYWKRLEIIAINGYLFQVGLHLVLNQWGSELWHF